MGVCSACAEELPSDYAICSLKQCELHFHCAGTSETTWRRKGAADKQQWKCPACRKQPPSSQPVSADEMRSFMAEVRRKMSVLDKLQELPDTVKDLEVSVQHFSEKYDEMIVKFAENNEKMLSMEKDMQELTRQVNQKDYLISEMEKSLRDSEQYARNKNIEICGIPELPEENLGQIMEKLADCLQIQLQPGDVDIMHRVPSWNKQKPPKIVVQFTTRTRRNVWLQNKKHGILTSDVIRTHDSMPIYINEHLTQHWKQLLADAKKEGKPKGYKVIWYKEGKVLAKKNFADKNVVRIVSRADLVKLV